MIKKLIISTLFISLFLIITIKNNAYGAYIKYPNNPVLIPGEQYDNQGISVSSTIKHNSKYYSYYGGSDGVRKSINLATSIDGINWTKFAGNPVVKADLSNPYICERGGVSDPFIFFDPDENIFKLWFTANCEPQATGVPRYWIKYATSQDGITWSIRSQPVLSSSFIWDNEIVAQPTVLKENGIYRLWFGARSSVTGNTIGYASSTDGINWIKKSTPALTASAGWEYSGVGGPEIEKINNQYVLFYHGSVIEPKTIGFATSSDAQTWTKSALPIFSIDSQEPVLNSPDVLVLQNNIYVYYGTRISNKWNVSLATEKPITQTPSTSPLIILPGLYASWSEDAILHNQATTYKDWILNPIVHEYDGIRQTLVNLNLEENKDFFIFPYDWRKSILSSAIDLNQFILDKLEANTTVNLVGHSLGGLVARAYAQQQGQGKVDKLITIGSPHLGAAPSYYAVAGGDSDRGMSFEWLAQKILIKTQKKQLETDRTAIMKVAPVFADLLPIYDFLQRADGTYIPIDDMFVKNHTLLQLSADFPSINPILSTSAGNKSENTQFGYKVKPRSIMDGLLDLYPDGRPTAKLFDHGDNAIILNSASQGSQKHVLNGLDHGEIVYKSAGIEALLQLLGIQYQSNDITEGVDTKIFPSIILLIKSPAQMTLYHNGQTYEQNKGMIFIQNPQPGQYTLSVKGLEKGHYTIHIGQIGQNQDKWDTIEGDITSDPPTSQTDSYQLYINPDDPNETVVNTDQLFDDLVSTLKNINNNYENTHLSHAIISAQKAKASYFSQDSHQLKSQLLSIHRKLFQILKTCPPDIALPLISALEKLETLYTQVLTLTVHPSQENMLDKLDRLRNNMQSLEQDLLIVKNAGTDVTTEALYLQYAAERIEAAQTSLSQQKLHYADILIESINDFLRLSRP